jgi:hypothetical protein
MDIERFKKLASQARSFRGLIDFADPYWESSVFFEIPSANEKDEYACPLASSDNLDFLAGMFGAGSDLHVWNCVFVSEPSEEVRESYSTHGNKMARYVLWTDNPRYRSVDLMKNFIRDFTLGWRLALAPIRAAEKAAAKEAEEAFQSRCDDWVKVFGDAIQNYKVDSRGNEFAGITFKKDPDFRAFYSRVTSKVMTAEQFSVYRPGTQELYGRGKTVNGSFDLYTFGAHLEMWTNCYPDDPANKAYRKIRHLCRV